jgi:glutathione S-transferase
MALRLFGVVASPWTCRVVLAAAVKGMDLAPERPAEGTKSPAYLKLNPFGKIPTLIDGRFVVYESAAILEYLDRRKPRPPLLPREAKAAARVRQIAAVVDGSLQDAVADLFRVLVGQRPDDPASIEEWKTRAAQAPDALEGLIARGKFAVGAHFTLADCYLIPALSFAMRFLPKHGVAEPLAQRPKLARYWSAVGRHRRVAPVLAQVDAFFAERLKGTRAA